MSWKSEDLIDQWLKHDVRSKMQPTCDAIYVRRTSEGRRTCRTHSNCLVLRDLRFRRLKSSDIGDALTVILAIKTRELNVEVISTARSTSHVYLCG